MNVVRFFLRCLTLVLLIALSSLVAACGSDSDGELFGNSGGTGGKSGTGGSGGKGGSSASGGSSTGGSGAAAGGGGKGGSGNTAGIGGSGGDGGTGETGGAAGAGGDGGSGNVGGAAGSGATGGTGGQPSLITPSNSVNFGALKATGIDLIVSAKTFNTDTDCTAGSALGDCQTVVVDQAPDACVCRADSYVLSDLTVSGTRSLVLFAAKTVVVAGTLDVSAHGKTDGAGVAFEYTAGTTSSTGAVGGSYASKGGGNSANPYGDPSLIPLVGGMTGQASCGGAPGGGGGALQISAGQKINVTGKVLAGGGAGQGSPASNFCNGGAGGGSGGAILIEAPAVEISGVLAANGGGAAGGASDDYAGWAGYDANASDVVASGGPSVSQYTCPLYGTITSGSGGKGAAGSTSAGSGTGGDSETGCLNFNFYTGNGGGGGGVGRIRINSATPCTCAGTVSPAATTGTVS